MKRRLLVVWLLLLASLAGLAMCGAAGYRRGYTGGYGAQTGYARGASGGGARFDTLMVVFTMQDVLTDDNNPASIDTSLAWGRAATSGAFDDTPVAADYTRRALFTQRLANADSVHQMGTGKKVASFAYGVIDTTSAGDVDGYIHASGYAISIQSPTRTGSGPYAINRSYANNERRSILFYVPFEKYIPAGTQIVDAYIDMSPTATTTTLSAADSFICVLDNIATDDKWRTVKSVSSLPNYAHASWQRQISNNGGSWSGSNASPWVPGISAGRTGILSWGSIKDETSLGGNFTKRLGKSIGIKSCVQAIVSGATNNGIVVNLGIKTDIWDRANQFYAADNRTVSNGRQPYFVVKYIRAVYSGASDVTAPNAPEIQYAVGGDGYSYIQWTPSSAPDISSYNLYRSFGGAYTNISSGSSFGLVDATAINGSPNFYKVSAVDRTGNESALSAATTTYPGKILSIPRPAYYALWFQDPGSSLSSAQLDSLAAFDAIVTGPFPSEGAAAEPAYTGFLAALRSRNSNIIVLQYAHPWQVRTDGQGANRSPYVRMKEYADTGADSSGYALNVDGQIVRGSEYAKTRIINFMRTGCADSVAFIWAEAYDKISRISGEYTGLFVDDIATDPDYLVYPTVMSGTPASAMDVIDTDRNGDVYNDGVEEPAAFRAYQLAFLQALRREFAQRGLSNRLIVINSNFGRATTPSATSDAIMDLVDGNMVEGANRWWPGNAASDTTWERAFAIRDMMTHTQVAPPMQMFQVHTDSSIAYQSEVLALANDAWVCANDYRKYGNSHIPAMPRRLPVPGVPTGGYSIALGGSDPDTLSIHWTNYDAKMIMERNTSASADTFAVWPYIVLNPTTHDTLSISKYWEGTADIGAPDPVNMDVTFGDNYNYVYWSSVDLAGDIDHFNIYRSTDSTSPTSLFKVVPEADKVSAWNWAWTDSTAVNDSTEYCYSVSAVDVAGNESTHVDYSCATPTDVLAPGVIGGVSASGGPGCIAVNWNTSGAPDFAYYSVERYRKVLGVWETVATRTNKFNSFFNDSTAISGALYDYYIVQCDDDNLCSAGSDTVTASWTGAVVGAPSALVVNANTPAQEQARLSWTGPSSLTNFVRYRIYRDTTAPLTYADLVDSTTSPTWDDTGAAYGVTYYYNVKALFSPGGLSAASNTAVNTNIDSYPPTSPTMQIAAGNGVNGIDLNWSDVIGASMYYVWRGVGSASTKIDSTATSAYTDATAAEATTYTYGVKARDSAWNMSLLSNTMTASWTSAPASGPTIASATGGTIQNGETITVSGVYFGEKSPAAPMLWETFDAGSNGAYLSTDVKWRNYWNPGAKYSNTTPYRGTGLCAYNSVTQGGVDSGFFTNTFTFPSPADTVYYSYMSRFVSDGDPYGVYKSGRSNTGSNQYSGPGNIYISNGGLYGWQDENSVYHDGNSQYFSQSTKNANWTRHQIYKYNAASATAWWAVGAEKHVLNGLPLKPAGQTYKQTSIILGLMDANLRTGATHHMYVDDVYVDRTQARVEIGDASTFDACTHTEIQIPSAWSNTSITVTTNTGTFANGTAYLFVVSADGTVSAGKAITISN